MTAAPEPVLCPRCWTSDRTTIVDGLIRCRLCGKQTTLGEAKRRIKKARAR